MLWKVLLPDWFALVGVAATLGFIYAVIKFLGKMSEGFESKLQEESEKKCQELDKVIHSIEEDPSLKLNLLDKVTLIETRTSQGKQSLQRIDSGGNLYANGDGLSYVGVHRRMEWKWKNIVHIINNRDSRPVNLDTLLTDIFFGGFHISYGQEIDAKHPPPSLESSTKFRHTFPSQRWSKREGC